MEEETAEEIAENTDRIATQLRRIGDILENVDRRLHNME